MLLLSHLLARPGRSTRELWDADECECIALRVSCCLRKDERFSGRGGSSLVLAAGRATRCGDEVKASCHGQSLGRVEPKDTIGVALPHSSPLALAVA